MKKVLLGAILLFSTLGFSQIVGNEYPFESLPTYEGKISTNETIPIYDKPDLVKGVNLGNIVGKNITIIKKENNKYYYVKSDNIVGYVFVGYIMQAYPNSYIAYNDCRISNCDNCIIKLGMKSETVLKCLGQPKTINKSVGSWGTHEQWVYEKKYYYFENGKLTSWQE